MGAPADGKRAAAWCRIGILIAMLLGAIFMATERAMSAFPVSALLPMLLWGVWFWLLDGLPSIRLLRHKQKP